MSRRIERVNHLIRQQISELLLLEVKDPRLGGMISITEVETTPDLKYAKIFISCMGTDEEKKEALNTLNSASGFLHKELSKRIELRHIPYLDFRWDDSIEKGAHIIDLMNKVNQEKAQD